MNINWDNLRTIPNSLNCTTDRTEFESHYSTNIKGQYLNQDWILDFRSFCAFQNFNFQILNKNKQWFSSFKKSNKITPLRYIKFVAVQWILLTVHFLTFRLYHCFTIGSYFTLLMILFFFTIVSNSSIFWRIQSMYTVHLYTWYSPNSHLHNQMVLNW